MRIPPAELMGTQVPQVQPNRRPFQMSDMTIPPAELMGDKKTVKKIFADPNKSDEIIETIEEKIPTGSAQWGNSRHPRNWLQRNDEGYFSRPQTSLMNLLSPNAWKDVAKRKWLERQARRY